MPMGPKGPICASLLHNTTDSKTMLDTASVQKPAMIALAGVSSSHLSKLGGEKFFTQLGQASQGGLRGILLSHMEDLTGETQ